MNAGVYTRYSPGGKQTDQSTEGQLRACYEFCAREGYTVVEEYNDRHITGRYDDRPEFQRMIKDSAKGIFDVVIVWKLDRFARNRYDSAIYKNKLKKNGVKVISAMERISDDPEGIILEGMLESMAEYYSANLSQNVRRGLRESALKGTFTGGTPTIGYKVVDKRLVIDEERAPIIRYAFEEYAKGTPKKEIVEAINAKGVRTSRGKPFTISSIQVALKNKKYIGVSTYSGVEYENTCPVLIERELFDKVQIRLASVARAPAAKKAKQEYLLQGKAFCGMCGSNLVGESGRSKSGEVYYYYACATKKKLHQCKKKNEKKDFLEWYVTEQTVEYVLVPERMRFIAGRLIEEYDKEFNNTRISEYEKRIDRLERDADKSFKLMLSAENPLIIKRFEKQLEELEMQKADLEIDLTKLKAAASIRYTLDDILAWLKQFCRGDLMDQDFRRRIIDTFINAVYVYDDKIVVYYNIKDSKQVSYIDNCDALDDTMDGEYEAVDSNGKVRISNASLRQ